MERRVTYSYKVEEANDDTQDAGGNEQAPERHTQGLLTSGLLIHVAEQVESNGHHSTTQGNEAVSGAQKRPVASEKVAEERAF